MIFRTKDEKLINIDRTKFNNDHDYYSYIRTVVIGSNRIAKTQCLIDNLIAIVKKK